MLRVFASNVLIYGATNGIKSLVPFLMLPILTAYLSVNDYGVLSIIEVTILLLVPLVSLNISSAINVEYFHREREEFQHYVSNALMLSLITFSLVLFCFIVFHEYISGVLHVESTIVLWLPIFAFLRVTTQVLLGIYQVTQQPKKFAFFTLSQTLFDFFLSYTLVVLFQGGFLGRLEGVYTAFFVFTVLALFLMYKNKFLTWPCFTYSREILTFGLPLVLHVICGTVMAMSDRYFISYFIGNESVGFYSVAYQLASLMILVGLSVNLAWSPMLFNLLKRKKSMGIVLKYSFLLVVFYVVIGAIIYLLQDMLFNILVDKKFLPAKEFFTWLLIGFIFQSLYFLVTNFFFFEKKTGVLAIFTVAAAVLNLVLNYFLIQSFGVIGVAYATAITWAVYFLVTALLVIFYYKNKSKHGLLFGKD